MGPAEFSKGSLVADRYGNLRKVSGQEADMNFMVGVLLLLVRTCCDALILCTVWPVEAIVRFKFWPPLTHKLIVNSTIAWA